MSSQYTIDDYNETELLEYVRRTTGLVVKRGLPRERLLQFVYQQASPTAEELSGTMESRRMLEGFLQQDWVMKSLGSQLPCKGPNQGKCTVYPCPEGRHLDCFVSNLANIRVHSRIA